MANVIVKNFKFIFFILFLNIVVIFLAYRGVFSLELEGDSWFYGWGHKVYYESNVFSPLSLKGMRTSLGGASLTFGLIQNHFGLSAIVFYSISVLIKFISVIAFYFLVKKLTGNFFASAIACLLLSASFAGVEATHWVFNMYAYIGLIFIIISMIIGVDLPERFSVRKWLFSFILACLGIWWATMRTNGFIVLILLWSLYKLTILRSRDSRLNLTFWIIGLSIFLLIDKFVLGQMESDYSSYYIIGAGIKAFQSQIAVNKYDFIFASAINLGAVILPDTFWNGLNFPKLFSIFGSTPLKSVIFPSFLIFSLIAVLINSIIDKGRKYDGLISKQLFTLIVFGFSYTTFIFYISKVGQLNFSSWSNLVMSLFGGYMMIISFFLVFINRVPSTLRDLFFLSFFWFFLFLLLPLFQNGGSFFGTYHRYMATTALSVPLFMAGLITLVLKFKNAIARILIFSLIILIFFSHFTSTKAFFNSKAVIHNREVSNRIWQQFKRIVPNKPQYLVQPPAIFFASADNNIDQGILFESLQYGYDFRADLEYGWPHNQQNYLFDKNNFNELLKQVKKNPKLLDDLYGLMVQDQNLFDITKQLKEKITEEIK